MLKNRALFLGLMAVLVAGFAPGGEAIPNWAAPTTWAPPRSVGVHTMTDVTLMLPFIGITPCRVADTRGNGFTGAYGPPSIAANTARSFTITGQCGIPATAMAVSFNFGALNVGAAGDLRVFPAGGAVPTVSTLNYNANTPDIANAAVVPLGTGGAITVQADAVSIDLIIDVNGYYASTPATGNNGLAIENSNTGAVLIGINDSTATGNSGMLGMVSSTSPGSFSAGVRGINNGTGGAGIGVLGSQNGNGYGVLGEALGTSGGNQRGVFGIADSSTDGTAGVLGEANATVGLVWGVEGVINPSTSAAAAGVYGAAGGGLPATVFGAAGVWGANASTYGGQWGVLGTGLARGVHGSRTDTAGNLMNAGVLGYSGTIGVYSFEDYGGAGVKYFIEPHPTDATKQINYISLEGPEAGTYFRGRGRFVNGQAVIPVPEDFRLVTEEEGLTVQITPIGRMAQVGVVSMDLNDIVAEGSRDVEFSYLVQGVRKGYADLKPIRENTIFVPQNPDDRMGPYPERIRQRLVSLGIYNEDGTVNMDTARRLGWDRVWEAKAEQARAAAAKRAAVNTGQQQ